MTSGTAGLTRAAPWQRVPVGDDVVAVAERAALGTSARVVVWPPENLGAACAATDDVLAALDRQASRFRPDSELSWLNDAGGGLFMLGDGLAEAVGVALAAARWTGGLTDPTVGAALVSLGYDRDFAAIRQGGEPPGGPDNEPPGAPAPRRAGRWCGSTGRCSGCRPASGWISAPRPKAWARTAPCGPPCPRPDTRAASWSAWAVTSPSPGRRPGTAGRSRWPRSRTRSDPRTLRNSSGWPRERSRPRRSAAAGGGAATRCCTTSWTRGPGVPRTGRGARRPWPRPPAPTPTRPARRRS